MSSAGIDRSTNPTVVEYAVQDLFKGKSPAAAANRTAKKFSGGENMFFGPGVTFIDPRALEAALWDRLAEHSAKAISKYDGDAEGWLGGTLQHFGQTALGQPSKPTQIEKLKALVVAKMGRNPFTTRESRRVGETMGFKYAVRSNTVRDNAGQGMHVGWMEAYVYNADLYCEDCGRALQEGKEDTGDSNDYPQGPYPDGGGESDGPQHCGSGAGCVNVMEFADTKVGVWLGNPLTDDGVEALKEMLSNPRPSAYQLALHEFWSDVYSDYLEGWEPPAPEIPSPQLPLPGVRERLFAAENHTAWKWVVVSSQSGKVLAANGYEISPSERSFSRWTAKPPFTVWNIQRLVGTNFETLAAAKKAATNDAEHGHSVVREHGDGLHPAPYSKKNLQTDDFLTLQPSRGGWIVDYKGEFMGSVKKLKGGWKIDPIHGGGPVGGRHYDACKRATELLDAYFAGGGTMRESVVRDYEGMTYEQWLQAARSHHDAHVHDNSVARLAYSRGIDPHQFVEMYGGFALEESVQAAGSVNFHVNFQRGERLRIRVKGPDGQPLEAFWFTVDDTMSLNEVALRFAQTAQAGMLIEVVSGKLKWTFQVERFAGQPSVKRVRGTYTREGRS